MSNTHLHIPASKDTLFMRGFSCRQDIDQIRDFFADKCGRNTVEFFKEDGNNQLFLALRFESKDVAKEVLHRFNDTEILGDRITMTWYKDLRRARPYNDYRRQSYRGNYGSDMYDYRGSYQRSGYQRGHYRPTSSSRIRKYSRSSSRSRSVSRSPSQSRSRSRSSSRSYESRDLRKKRDISDSANRKHKPSTGKKRVPVEGTQAGYESSESQNSPAVAPPTSAGATGTSPMKKKANAPEIAEHQQQMSPAKRMKQSMLNKVQPAAVDHEQALVDLDQSVEGIDYAYENSPAKPSRQGVKSSVQKKVAIVKGAEDKMHLSEWVPVDTQAVDSIPSATNAKRFAQPFQQPQTSVREQPAVTQNKEAIASISKSQNVKRASIEERKVVSYDEDRSDVEEDGNVAPLQQQSHHVVNRGDNVSSAAVPRAANKSTKENSMSVNSSDPRMQAYDPMENDMARLQRKRKAAVDLEDDVDAGLSDGARQRYEGFEDGRRMRRSANADARELHQGSARSVMGLSHEKVIMIKEKKEEVEKAYRQDCETFATVTKLLISKDPDLEDRIQNSLRENLRDIGYRCIQELRDFVDRIKCEDDF